MSTEGVFESLLESVTQGEGEVKDPREGIHPDAVFQGAELATKQDGSDVIDKNGAYYARIMFADMVDSDGKAFDLSQSQCLPNKASHPVSIRMFLSFLHDLGIVPRAHKAPLYAETRDQAQAFVDAMNTKAQASLPIKITMDNQGYASIRLLRTKTAQAAV